MLKQLSWDEVTAAIRGSQGHTAEDNLLFLGLLESALARESNSLGVVLFENHTFDSSHFGDRQGVLIFADGTINFDVLRSLIENPMSRPIGDVPSRFMYAQWYYLKPGVELPAKEKSEETDEVKSLG